MAETAYFDSSLWVAILAEETTVDDVTTLIQEIKRDRGRILTSILTLTEISVRAYSQDPQKVTEGMTLVSAAAAICNLTQEVALLTAKIEAQFMTSVWSAEGANLRRRWDALHLATAAPFKADVFYTFDKRLLNADFSAEPQIPPLKRPQPRQGSLRI